MTQAMTLPSTAFTHEIGTVVRIIDGEQAGLVAQISDRGVADYDPHLPIYFVQGDWYEANALGAVSSSMTAEQIVELLKQRVEESRREAERYSQWGHEAKDEAARRRHWDVSQYWEKVRFVYLRLLNEITSEQAKV